MTQAHKRDSLRLRAEARLEHHRICEAVNKGDAWGTGGLTMAMVLIKLAQLDEIIRKDEDNGN